MIDVARPQCGVVYHSEQAHFGKQIRCVKCGCMVPIAMLADRAVAPTAPPLPRRRAIYPPSTKLRRIYGFATAAVVVAATVISVVVLRNRNVSKRSATAPSEIQEQAPARPGLNPGSTGSWLVVGEEPAGDASPQLADEHKPLPTADPRPTDYNSLPTGTRIEEDIGTAGHGELTVENGTSEDAVVRLCDVATGETSRWFFVQAHSAAHRARIPQGTYRLIFTTGLNWVESEDTFSWHPSYSEFDRTFVFREQRDSEGVQYKAISVTLNPVLFGNVETKTITREEFLKGYRHAPLQ